MQCADRTRPNHGHQTQPNQQADPTHLIIVGLHSRITRFNFISNSSLTLFSFIQLISWYAAENMVTIWQRSFIINSRWLPSFFLKKWRDFWNLLRHRAISLVYRFSFICFLSAPLLYYVRLQLLFECWHAWIESVYKMKPVSLWRRAFWVWDIFHSRHLRVNPWTINYLTTLAPFFHVSEWRKGPSIKYVTLFLMIFDPPPLPLSQTVTNLGPPKSMSHFWTKS